MDAAEVEPLSFFHFAHQHGAAAMALTHRHNGPSCAQYSRYGEDLHDHLFHPRQ